MLCGSDLIGLLEGSLLLGTIWVLRSCRIRLRSAIARFTRGSDLHHTRDLQRDDVDLRWRESSVKSLFDDVSVEACSQWTSEKWRSGTISLA